MGCGTSKNKRTRRRVNNCICKMKTFFKELFQYNNHFNQEVISVLNETPERASGNCIKLLSHILNVHQIWNCKIQPDQLPYEAWEIHQIQDFYEIDRKNFE